MINLIIKIYQNVYQHGWCSLNSIAQVNDGCSLATMPFACPLSRSNSYCPNIKIYIILRLTTINKLGKDDALMINMIVVSSVMLTILQGPLVTLYTHRVCVQ